MVKRSLDENSAVASPQVVELCKFFLPAAGGAECSGLPCFLPSAVQESSETAAGCGNTLLLCIPLQA